MLIKNKTFIEKGENTIGDWTINEEQAQKIIDAKPIKVRKPKNYKNVHMSDEERIKQAKEILRGWRDKKELES